MYVIHNMKDILFIIKLGHLISPTLYLMQQSVDMVLLHLRDPFELNQNLIQMLLNHIGSTAISDLKGPK